MADTPDVKKALRDLLAAIAQSIGPGPIDWRRYYDAEHNARAALAAADAVPAGWKLVPIEPTQEMLSAGCEAALAYAVLTDDTRFACEWTTWQAMLAAAPSEPRHE